MRARSEITNDLQRNIGGLKADFRHESGHHSMFSPVVSSRAKELELIYAHREVFAEYQKVIYDQQKLNVIPVGFKEKADEISKEIYEEYIKKYSAYGLTLENSVSWSDSGLTRTYLSDLENEWNTWEVQAVVAKPNHSSHVEEQMYRPAYICALHELMHVEETPPGILKSEYARFKSVVEVLTVTKTLILLDEVYKKTLNLPMNIEVDYKNSFHLFGKSIEQGELANFYRKLGAKYPSLAEALVSKESLAFLNQPDLVQTKKLTTNRIKIRSGEHGKEINTEPTSSMTNISMKVLGGFIAAAGITVVAIAFTLPSAVTFGSAELIVAGVGVALALSGMGLFAVGAYKNKQTISDDSLDFSGSIAFQ